MAYQGGEVVGQDFTEDEMSQAGELSYDELVSIRSPHIPNEIWMKVVGVFKEDWKDASCGMNFRSFAFQTLKEISLVNTAFRHYAQSVLFRLVLFAGCFSAKNYEKFCIITQPHIARHIQELFVNATIMCTKVANTHQPLKTSPANGGTSAAISGRHARYDPTQKMMSDAMQHYLEDVAKQRMRLLLGMCSHSLKKLTFFARDQHDPDLDTEKRNLIALWSFSTAIEALRTVDFPNLTALALVAPDAPQALWDLTEELSVPSMRGIFHHETIAQRNFARLKELNLFFKHDFGPIGKFVSFLGGCKLDTLEVQLGYCDYQPYCPIKLPGVQFDSLDIVGLEKVTILGLERLLVNGKFSEAFGALSRLQRLELVEIQLGLESGDDTWAEVLRTCASPELLPSLTDLKLRRVAYTCKNIARCGVWNTTVREPNGKHFGRAMCTASNADVLSYHSAMAYIKKRRELAGITADPEDADWIVCRHRIWISK